MINRRRQAGEAAYTRSQAVHDATLAPPRRDQNGRPEARGVRLRTIVKGKNAEVPERVRDYAERKLKRIDRLLDDQTDATVELWSEHHKSAATSHVAELTLIVHGQALRSRATGTSYQEALDDVVDKAERIAVGYKEKPRLRARPEEEKQILRRLADGSAGPGREPRIVKVKRFAIEPMFEEDAVAAMEELGHQFFVFVNAETERVAILYQRQDGDFGLIEPAIGGDYTKGRPRASDTPAKSRLRPFLATRDSTRASSRGADAPTPARQALPLGAAP